ncbi:hypothetical protein RclHR1_29270001 [Rhizophagus clarus]|uniref:Uncharacterized protein n=1 Tax=Rhizophagus clarus TaxID=94130 RepID=A0A2Z6R877_9GLOM|nr:hypothetical protein RclHR1_29270001 [Rhizophagus clarus]GET04441.1 hypothetical protein GLOIN_2v1885829 [Rhizophagus clarus]
MGGIGIWDWNGIMTNGMGSWDMGWDMGWNGIWDFPNPINMGGKYRLDRDVREKALYQLLFDLYAEEGINEPFAVFYDIFCDRVNNPLSKNFVFHVLRALGLVTKMSRIVVDGREKSIISINATREELLELFRKNGIDY